MVRLSGTLESVSRTLNIYPHNHGASKVVPDFEHDNRWMLWRLTDYVVTSVSGGSIWLSPRRAETEAA
jgi:hypothetical protein